MLNYDLFTFVNIKPNAYLLYYILQLNLNIGISFFNVLNYLYLRFIQAV